LAGRRDLEYKPRHSTRRETLCVLIANTLGLTHPSGKRASAPACGPRSLGTRPVQLAPRSRLSESGRWRRPTVSLPGPRSDHEPAEAAETSPLAPRVVSPHTSTVPAVVGSERCRPGPRSASQAAHGDRANRGQPRRPATSGPSVARGFRLQAALACEVDVKELASDGRDSERIRREAIAL
jgi:hypothetical protein